MVYAEFFAYHPHLGKGINEHFLKTLSESVKPVFKPSEAYNGKQPEYISEKKQNGKDEYQVKQRSFYTTQEGLLSSTGL
jgi:hypothetical protein